MTPEELQSLAHLISMGALIFAYLLLADRDEARS